MSFSIVPSHLAVKAMRDNGYKNAAHALAELMDNSIQAGAKNVELLIAEESEQLRQRQRKRVTQIAVLDDAAGMSADVLRMALQFGNGTRLQSEDQTGIGRFGMGLPASSISQCRRVDVWTWQDGIESAIWSYLDLDEIIEERMQEVPASEAKKLPDQWLTAARSVGKSGTLVVWSQLDRLIWKTAKALIDNSELIVGRMYRRFLDDGRVSIRLASFDVREFGKDPIERPALSNDPSYLMRNTSTPAPWNEEPMFKEWPDENEATVIATIAYEGADHEVKIKFSFAKEEARKGHNPGSLPYGKHAKKNVGVSIVRAERELELDDSWSDPSDPRERWWGIEIEFPPALDEVFGVTNNKQHAHTFSNFAAVEIGSLLEDGQTLEDVKREFIEDDDPRGALLDIVNIIQRNRNTLRRLLQAQTSRSGANRKRHDVDDNSPEKKATDATRARQEEGHSGKSDEGEQLSDDERTDELEADLVQQGVDEKAAATIAARTISDGQKYVFAEIDMESPAFFSVRQKGGTNVITLNTNHPAHSRLIEVLGEESDGLSEEELRGRLNSASDGLKLLLLAWARFEDEEPDGARRERAQETRINWGKLARYFLRDE